MVYFNPLERGIEETSRFLSSTLPKPPCHVLEVGCGSGAVASRLKNSGYAMTGIDLEPESVGSARERGIEAVEGDVRTYRGGPFDAVVFTRSLHHCEAISEVVERAHSMLKPGGCVVLEEFAVEKMDLETARWYYELQSLLEATGILPADPTHETPASTQLERWFEEHAEEGEIHTGEDMIVALGSRFSIQATHSAPYLYRYVSERIEPSARGVRVANWVFEVESMRIAQMTLKPVGLRILAHREK